MVGIAADDVILCSVIHDAYDCRYRCAVITLQLPVSSLMSTACVVIITTITLIT